MFNRAGGCYNCGSSGHRVAMCPNPKATGTMTCFKCGLEGHMARNCTHNNAPSGGGGVSVKPCYKCGVVGHIARDCAKQIKCYNCSETGHISRHCPHPQTCHLCKKEGHEQMECPDKFILDTEVIEYFLKLTRNISAVRTT